MQAAELQEEQDVVQHEEFSDIGSGSGDSDDGEDDDDEDSENGPGRDQVNEIKSLQRCSENYLVAHALCVAKQNVPAAKKPVCFSVVTFSCFVTTNSAGAC